MKRDIYKGIPEGFHRQFEETLERLDDCDAGSKRTRRKYGLILAAAVLACASVTAAAAGLMGWHESLSSHFGTEKELEDKLSMEGAATLQDAVAEGGGLKFQALQAVRTDTYGYFLIEMTAPEGIEWNSDILFETCEVVGEDYGCVSGFVADSYQDGKVLMELQILYYDEKVPDGAGIRVRLQNLVQTEKTRTTACLVKGEWEISLSLPAEAETLRFYPESEVELGEHTLYFEKVDISPFRIRIYTEKEAALHAVWGHSTYLSGLEYDDGTVVAESGMQLSMSGHADEADEFCFEISLDTAIDPDKVTALMIRDGEVQRKISLGRREAAGKETGKTPEVSGEGSKTGEGDLSAGTEADGRIADVRLLYVRYDNVVFEAGDTLWLWDAGCGRSRKLASLADYGFSWEQGAEIGVWGEQIQILPYAGSDQVFLYTITDRSMLTLDAAEFWPWPTYETYQERCKGIGDLIPEADERYAGQAHFAPWKSGENVWYYLYSEDGTIGNMELRTAEGR